MRGVPPGTYTIEVVQEKLGKKEGKLTLACWRQRHNRFHYMAVENTYHRGLYRWSILLAFCTLLLVVAGGLVTSRDAGLSVPDWPLSYGKLMPKMEGGILYEHGHRMIATTVGLFTIVSLVWIFRVERRKWMRTLAIAALPRRHRAGCTGRHHRTDAAALVDFFVTRNAGTIVFFDHRRDSSVHLAPLACRTFDRSRRRE